MTHMAKQMGLWNQAELQSCAYPIHHTEAFLIVTKSGRNSAYSKTRSAPFLHLWNEIFRRYGSSALDCPSNGSFLADLYKQHGVRRGWWTLPNPFKRARTLLGKSANHPLILRARQLMNPIH